MGDGCFAVTVDCGGSQLPRAGRGLEEGRVQIGRRVSRHRVWTRGETASWFCLSECSTSILHYDNTILVVIWYYGTAVRLPV